MEEANQTCPNCNRDIPAINFVTHSLHCTRNIKICAVCKEPVPQSDLEEHNEKLHKLMPCKRCGDMVRGTDLEDHVRDSCAFTMQSCRFCTLELQRREVPTHERYCGARTEQCAECGEWVMLRYRQLHVDSNHGFVRLDDDSLPRPNRALGTPPANVGTRVTRAFPRLSDLIATQPDRIAVTRAEQRVRAPLAQPEESTLAPAIRASKATAAEAGGVAVRAAETAVPRASSNTRQLKRTNEQPQINMNVTTKDKAQKNLGVSRGAVKKRPAPRPPAPSADPRRDLPYYSALQRRQDEERRRREQNALNLALGLPPVLDPAAKLEKLRKMDELHNREIDSTDYKNKLQGRVWQNSDVASAWQANGEGASGAYVNGKSANVPQDAMLAWQRRSLRDLKPMSPEEFVVRFEKLRCRDPAPRDIRSSLRELRRGLNEVTAPYNNNNTSCNDANCSRTAGDTGNKNNSRQANADNMLQTNHTAEEEEVPLPCQFCSETFKVDDLLSHEAVCGQAGVARALADDDPIIPCEFCGRPMPYYLIGEHQELCDREVNQLYPD